MLELLCKLLCKLAGKLLQMILVFILVMACFLTSTILRIQAAHHLYRHLGIAESDDSGSNNGLDDKLQY